MSSINELLIALGRDTNSYQRLWLFFMFVTATTGFSLILAIPNIGNVLVQWWGILLHIIAWGCWFFWQGYLFPLNRKRNIEKDPVTAYKKAFYRHIRPGISLGVSLMDRPLSYGFMTNETYQASTWCLIAASCAVTIGILLLYSGFKAVGIAGAGFLYEYMKRGNFVKHGIYAEIRHPLFLGGVISSLGISLFFCDLWTIAFAIVNVSMLPIYARIEDARLVKLFGPGYAKYTLSVGAFIPKENILRSLTRSNLKKGSK